jgi:hypothetical protein
MVALLACVKARNFVSSFQPLSLSHCKSLLAQIFSAYSTNNTHNENAEKQAFQDKYEWEGKYRGIKYNKT